MTNGETHSHLTPSNGTQQVFIPHVTRIAQLMDLRYVSHSPVRLLLFFIYSFSEIATFFWFVLDPDTTERTSFGPDLPKYQQSPRVVWILFDIECPLANA